MLAECQSKSEGDLSAMHGEDNFEEWISDGEVDDGDLHDDPDGDLGASILTAHTWADAISMSEAEFDAELPTHGHVECGPR